MHNKTETETHKGMPGGIPYIIGNEAAERFSYYGMKSILWVFMTSYLMDSSGNPDTMDGTDANFWVHIFGLGVYLFPIIGSIISDVWWGKYKTIITLSIVYCLGHVALAMFETRLGLSLGLTLIAIGSGGIKPCVSAHVGDQFTKHNQHLIEKVFSIFYFSINVGAALSSLLTPLLLEYYGPSLAFGVPGGLMILATWVFWLGRRKFIAIRPAGWQRYKKDVLNPDGKKVIARLSFIYLFVAVFWSLFDQTSSSWVDQATKMDKHIDLTFGLFSADWLKFELLPSQIQAVNPFLIWLFIPLFTYFIYPYARRYFAVSPMQKITVGFFVAALSFVVVALSETWLQSGQSVHITWQVLSYIIITIAEVLISITALEYSYTQAPNTMKSFIMGLFWLSVALGNGITAMVNLLIKRSDGSLILQGAEYYWFFAAIMLVTAFIFVPVGRRQKDHTYIQSREDIIPTDH